LRQIHQTQFALLPSFLSDFQEAQELEQMSQVLDANPDISELVYQDLVGEKDARVGRKGLTGDQVLRLGLIKQLRGYSYEELPFRIADSWSVQRFVRIGIGDLPSDSAIWDNVTKVRAQTWQSIMRRIAEVGIELGVDDGSRVRGDCTVVESNIHYPTDSSLLFDFVRVAARTLGSIYGKEGLWFIFSDHTTRAKRRHINIFWTTGKPGAKAKRKKLYQRLLRVARKTAGYIENALKALDGCTAIWAYSVVEELRELLDLGRKVIDQTRRRVILGDSVPAEEKIVSIFEPHTDIIRKDAFDTYFGHKVLLGNGVSTLILDCLVLDGNPSDTTLVAPFIDRVAGVVGRVPKELAFDGGFSSRENLEAAVAKGVETICFAKHPGIQPEEMASSKKLLKELRHFRAGVEATISFLKHGFGWLRCIWRGKARFHSYVYSAAAAFNLQVIARHLVADST
jgi:IS5 family transposase